MQPSSLRVCESMTVADESFVLCDAGVNGCAIRFASREFADLFGYDANECVGKTYGALVGCHSIVGSGKQGLFALAASTGLPISMVEKGFKVLMSSVKQLYARIQQDPELCGHTLQLNRKKDGTVFVCELRMMIKTHSSVQWPYCLAVQTDVSDRVSSRTEDMCSSRRLSASRRTRCLPSRLETR